MTKILAFTLIVATFIISCKKENKTSTNNTNNNNVTSPTAQQSKLIYIGYNTSNVSFNDLLSVSYDGTGTTNLFTPPSGQLIGNTVLSPDDKTLYIGIFFPVSVATYGDLYLVGIASGSSETKLVDESGTATTTDLNPYPIGTIPATATQAGQLLYGIGSNSGNSFFEYHTANLDGTGDKKINIPLPANIYVARVSLFQDKKSLLLTFSSTTNNNSYSVATCNIDGTNFKTLGQINSTQTGPGFIAAVEGTSLQGNIFYYKTIYDSNNNFLNDEIWVSNVDLSGLKKLNIALPTSDLFIGDISSDISVSPDGKTIFFSVSSHNGVGGVGNRGIYSCNIDGSNVKVVVPVDLTGVNDYLPYLAY